MRHQLLKEELNNILFNIKESLLKNHVENVLQNLVPDSFLILVNNSKQLLRARIF